MRVMMLSLKRCAQNLRVHGFGDISETTPRFHMFGLCKVSRRCEMNNGATELRTLKTAFMGPRRAFFVVFRNKFSAF